MTNGGILEEDQMGYTSYYGEDGSCPTDKDHDPVASITGLYKLPTNSYGALMNALAKTGPVAVTVACDGWISYDSGIYHNDSGIYHNDSGIYHNDSNATAVDYDLNHLVVAVGYGTDESSGLDYWIVRNSWGPAWGEEGYIRVLREDPNLVDSACGQDTTPGDGSGCKGGPKEVKVCGTSGILFDNTIAVGGYIVKS